MTLDDVLVWSDTHIGHRNIFKFCGPTRPQIADPENPTDEDIFAMDLWLISNWNKRAKGKTIYMLGDFTFSRDKVYNQKIFDKLEGDKHLIIGNHDHRDTRALNWSSVNPYKTLKVDGETFILSHYPMSSWDKMIHGTYHLYGHVHGEWVPGKDTLRMLDVGVDNGFPEPITLREVVERLQDRTPTNPPVWS